MLGKGARYWGVTLRRTADILAWASLAIVALHCEARAQGPYALVAGRWEPVVVVVDIAAALEPENDRTANAVVGRVRVTPDITGDGEGASLQPAAGLPSNVTVSADGRTAWVVNHAGRASAADVGQSAHGHPGSLTALSVRAAIDPINDGTTYAMNALLPGVGVGPVGVALLRDAPVVIVSSSEGVAREDGGRVLSFVDLASRQQRAAFSLALGDGGRVVQRQGSDCAALAIEASRVPRTLPDGDVGCFPNVNGLVISRRDATYVITANGGTDDVSIVAVERALRGDPNAEVARVPVDVGPWGIAGSANGRYVAVANRESSETGAEGNTVSILDVDRAVASGTGALAATIRVGTDDPAEPTRPFGLAFASNDRMLVVANFRSNTVSIVDLDRALAGRGDAETARIALQTPTGAPARPRGVAVTPDGRYAAVSGGLRDTPGSGWLWIVDLSTREVAATVTSIGNEPYGLAIAVDPG
jgi:DNA-binding beta-propeller fold protein YncE